MIDIEMSIKEHTLNGKGFDSLLKKITKIEDSRIDRNKKN